MSFTKKTYTAGQTKIPADNLNEIQDEIIRQAALPHLTHSQVETLANSAAATQIGNLPSYLPLAGGTMNAGSKITHPGNASYWKTGLDNAILRRPNSVSNSGAYYPLVASKTVSGNWAIGTLDDQLQLNYISDSDSSLKNFLFNSDGNLYWNGGIKLVANGTLGASASTTLSGTVDDRIYKNLIVNIMSIYKSGNQYSSFVIPVQADTWHFFLPTYNDYYRTAVTITGSGGNVSVMLQMDSNVSGTFAWIYATA